MSILLFVLIA
jgi:hypothetical protein